MLTLFVKSGEQKGSFLKNFESDITGKLSFVYIKDGSIDSANDNACISNVHISNNDGLTISTPMPIDSNVGAQLDINGLNYGDIVYCIVTLSDGKRIKSNEIELQYVNFIKTQPTAENLTIELDTPEDGTKYQWYQVGELKVDSKSVTPITSGEYPWVENGTLWFSGNMGQGSSISTMTATIEVEDGDILSFDWLVSSEKDCDWLYCTINGEEVLKKSGENNGSYQKEFYYNTTISIEFKFTKDKYVDEGSDFAQVSNIKLTRPSGFIEIGDVEISGAIDSYLDESQFIDGNVVFCKVILPNGRILVSDRVQTIENYIVKQPINEDLTVELYMPSLNATYQWFKEETTESIQSVRRDISSHLTASNYFWNLSDQTWEARNSYNGGAIDYLKINYYLQRGDSLEFECNVYELERTADWFEVSGEGIGWREYGKVINKYKKFIIEGTGKNTDIWIGYWKGGNGTNDILRAKVYNINVVTQELVKSYVSTPLQNATSYDFTSNLNEVKNGDVIYCEVTLPNGRKIQSERVSLVINGIEDVIGDCVDGYVVYDLNGICLMKTNDKSDLRNLHSGIYIINGIKTYVR